MQVIFLIDIFTRFMHMMAHTAARIYKSIYEGSKLQ